MMDDENMENFSAPAEASESATVTVTDGTSVADGENISEEKANNQTAENVVVKENKAEKYGDLNPTWIIPQSLTTSKARSTFFCTL